MTNNVFRDKKVKTQQQQNKKSNIKNPGSWTRDLSQPKRCVTSAPPSQLRVSIVVKLFNYFDAMDHNVNKQNRIFGPHIFNQYIITVIFLHACLNIFDSFFLREYVSLLKYGLNVRCKPFWPKIYRQGIFKISLKRLVFGHLDFCCALHCKITLTVY